MPSSTVNTKTCVKLLFASIRGFCPDSRTSLMYHFWSNTDALSQRFECQESFFLDVWTLESESGSLLGTALGCINQSIKPALKMGISILLIVLKVIKCLLTFAKISR